MGHAEVAESPCQHGGHHQRGVRFSGTCVSGIGLYHAQISGKFSGVRGNGIKTSGSNSAESNDDQECYSHGESLN